MASHLQHSLARPTLAMAGASATRERGPDGKMDTVVLPAGTVLWECAAHQRGNALEGHKFMGTLPAIAKSCGSLAEMQDVNAYRLRRDVKLLNMNSKDSEETQLACAVKAVQPLPRELQMGLASALSAIGEHVGSPMVMAMVFPLAAACHTAAVQDHAAPLETLKAPSQDAGKEKEYDHSIDRVLTQADALLARELCSRPMAYGADGWFRRETMESAAGASYLDEVLICRGAVASALQEVDVEELSEEEYDAVMGRIRELARAIKAADPDALAIVRAAPASPAGGEETGGSAAAAAGSGVAGGRACDCPCHKSPPGTVMHMRPCCGPDGRKQ